MALAPAPCAEPASAAHTDNGACLVAYKLLHTAEAARRSCLEQGPLFTTLRPVLGADVLLVQADLVAYKPRPKVKAAQNLLKAGAASQPDETAQEEVLETPVDTTWWSLFKPNVSIALVSESSVHAASAVPPWVRLCDLQHSLPACVP